MNAYKVSTIALLGLSMSITACSGVNFTPADGINASLEAPLADGTQKETFAFDDNGAQAKVDVLFVVDNSGSMMEEQQKLGAALTSFINGLGKADWQIGITTTDVSDGPFGIKGSLVNMSGTGTYILNKNTPNFATVFKNTVVREELLTCNNADKPCPSSDERPLEAIIRAIQKRNTDNAGFFRPGANLAVVILSDEDENSNGAGAIAPAQVISTFHSAFGTAKSLSTYGILIEPGDTACFDSQKATSGQYGSYASNLAMLTGGVTGSICDADYGPALSTIGNRVLDLVKSVTLKVTPNPSSLRLVVTPADPGLTWSIVGNSLQFNKAPTLGTRIDVFYLPDGQ